MQAKLTNAELDEVVRKTKKRKYWTKWVQHCDMSIGSHPDPVDGMALIDLCPNTNVKLIPEFGYGYSGVFLCDVHFQYEVERRRKAADA